MISNGLATLEVVQGKGIHQVKVATTEPTEGNNHHANVCRMISFFSLVALGVATQTAFKLSQRGGVYKYNTLSAMCVVEFIKLLLSLLHQEGERRQRQVSSTSTSTSQQHQQRDTDTLLAALRNASPAVYQTYALLALSYAVYNQLIFAVMKVADPGTFSLLKSFTPFLVSVLNCCLFGRALTQLQWYCVVIQILGIIPVITTTSAGGDGGEAAGTVALGYPAADVFLMVFCCLMNSINTVYNASVIKKINVPVPVQNIILYSFGVLINTVLYFAFASKDSKPFFYGYGHPGVWLLLVMNSFIGITITMIYKYGDAVLKTLATPLSSAILVFISYMLFDMPLNVVKAAGAGIVVVDTLLYLKLPSLPMPKDAADENDRQGGKSKQHVHSRAVASLVILCVSLGANLFGPPSSLWLSPQPITSKTTLKEKSMKDTSVAATQEMTVQPQYALELSGGLRSFLTTWPMLYENLILPNGGQENFAVSLAASYDESYRKRPTALQMVHHIANKYNFLHTELWSDNNQTRTCDFYGLEPDCTYENFVHFPNQWEMVTRAHQALTTRNDSFDLYVRIRPDAIVMSPINLTHVHDTLQKTGKEVWIPCSSDRFAREGRSIDDFAIGTKKGMDAYAAKFPFDRTKGCCETYVKRILGNSSHEAILANYGLLRVMEVPQYLETGKPFYRWTDNRCSPKIEKKQVEPKNITTDLHAYNMTHLEETKRLAVYHATPRGS